MKANMKHSMTIDKLVLVHPIIKKLNNSHVVN